MNMFRLVCFWFPSDLILDEAVKKTWLCEGDQEPEDGGTD